MTAQRTGLAVPHPGLPGYSQADNRQEVESGCVETAEPRFRHHDRRNGVGTVDGDRVHPLDELVVDSVPRLSGLVGGTSYTNESRSFPATRCWLATL